MGHAVSAAGIATATQCDAACPAVATSSVLLENGGILVFCSHHLAQHEPAICEQMPYAMVGPVGDPAHELLAERSTSPWWVSP